MFNVAVVGATGAVGSTMIRVLEERGFPVTELRPLASARSAGTVVEYLGKPFEVQELTENSFEGIQIALFSAGGQRSRDFAPAAVEAGAVVIDNSSAFRMDPNVPLVVPEVNEADLEGHQGVIANPNCVAAPLVVALKPIADAVGLERLIGQGWALVAQLEQAQRASALRGRQGLLDPGGDQRRGHHDVGKAAPGRVAAVEMQGVGVAGLGSHPGDPGTIESAGQSSDQQGGVVLRRVGSRG